MNAVIWKYPLDAFKPEVLMPQGAKILSVQTQQGVLCLWVLIPDALAAKVARVIRVIGTGHSFDNEGLA